MAGLLTAGEWKRDAEDPQERVGQYDDTRQENRAYVTVREDSRAYYAARRRKVPFALIDQDVN